MLAISTVDSYASIATALGTLILAIATFQMARKTAAMAEETKSSARAGELEAKASNDLVQLQRDQRRDDRLPLVVPITGGLGVTSTNTGDVRIGMPVENIGVGPALALYCAFETLDQNGDPTAAGQLLQAPAQRPGLAPGERHEFRVEFGRHPTNPVLPFRVHLEFRDVFGNRYRCFGRFFPAEGRFRELQFQRLDEKGRPLESHDAVERWPASSGGFDASQ